MNTKSNTSGKRKAAKGRAKTATTARRSAQKRSTHARSTTSRSAGDTTRKSAPKRRRAARSQQAHPNDESTSMSSALKLRASHTRDALLHVPHTREAIERELPRTRAVFKRAQQLTDWSRELMTRLRNTLTGLTDRLHLPRLPSKRTA